MGLDISFSLYVGGDADLLIESEIEEVKREPRFSQTTGERIEDYVETATIFKPKKGIALSGGLVRLYAHDDWVSEGDLQLNELNLDDDKIVFPAVIDTGSIHYSSIQTENFTSFFRQLAEAEMEFRRLTQFMGETSVYKVKSYSY